MESGAHHSYVCSCILPLQHCRVMRVFGSSTEQGALFSVSVAVGKDFLYGDRIESPWCQ